MEIPISNGVFRRAVAIAKSIRLGKGSIIVSGLLLLLSGCNRSQSSPVAETGSESRGANVASAVTPTPRVPAHFDSIAPAQPLPAVLDPSQFSEPAVVKAYTYAKQNPEIFAQQPCYCYCDSSFGHRSLLDCYASDHSVGCPLCLKEGLLVHRLHQEGKNASEIRNLIVQGEWKNVRLE